MAFLPRTYSQILDDMVNYVLLKSDLTDIERGSVIRSILEACAIEDDEQYFQMVELLDSFSLRTATGDSVDRRAEEWDRVRLAPAPSIGQVTIQDGLLETDFLDASVSSGATTFTVENDEDFPTSGFPYTVRIGEGLASVEDVVVSSLASNLFTGAALANDHSAGERVSYVSGVADRNFTAGIQVQAPSSGSDPAILFTTTGIGTLVNGNFESTPITVQSTLSGSNTKVGAGQVTEFTSAPPFGGAIVTNKASITGGRGRETTPDFVNRVVNSIQSLSRAITVSLEEAVSGVSDPVSGQRILTANVFEDFDNDEVVLYVDDGSGLVPSSVNLASDALASAVVALDPTIQVVDDSEFPEEGFVLVSPENASQIELLEYEAINRTSKVMTLNGTATNAHDLGDEVVFVEVLTSSAEAGTIFLDLANVPLIRNSIRLWVDTGSGYTAQTEETDYFLNLGRGRVQFASALATGASVVASYDYYTGVLFEAQKVINGDPNDEVNFPGYGGAGVKIIVEPPVVRRISVRAILTPQVGFDINNLVPLAQVEIEEYLNALGIGEDVIISEIIERVMSISGVYNVKVTSPTDDISISSNEVPVPTDSSGNTLVTVS